MIVVMAILAAISMVTYAEIQGRARDSQRMQDMNTIAKALEMYKVLNGHYLPTPSPTPNGGGWHLSTDGSSATNFLSTLVSASNGVTSIPLDPLNKANNTGGTSLAPTRSGTNFMYFYYRYSPGEWGCDASRGRFYVLGVTRLEGINQDQSAPSSPGFSCTNRDWSSHGAWVTGKFTN